MQQKFSKEIFIEQFKNLESSLNGKSNSEIFQKRKSAISNLEKLGFPTTKNEDWKYTDLSKLYNFNFAVPDIIELNHSVIDNYHISGLNENILVFINGIFFKQYSFIISQPEGVIIDNFNNVQNTKPEILNQHLAKYAEIQNGFTALNTALASDGAVIFIPNNTEINGHIHILNLIGQQEKNIFFQQRNLIISGSNSKAKIIESYHSLNGIANFSNIVNEILIGENSNIEIYRIQQENYNSFHINYSQAHQLKNSNYTHYSVTLGGGLVRNDTNIKLDDENSTGNLYGLYITEDSQHVDNHTLIDHAKPHCQSNELYKGVLDGNSRGVFNGKVFVRKDAQKTNAYQSNKAILLSDDAKIDTKPQLEIFADDVKCSHGAAIGQLDDESVFYLRSRGIGEELARTVLIRAFANDIFETIENENFHSYLNNLVFDKLK